MMPTVSARRGAKDAARALAILGFNVRDPEGGAPCTASMADEGGILDAEGGQVRAGMYSKASWAAFPRRSTFSSPSARAQRTATCVLRASTGGVRRRGSL